ncbi:MAG: hypothetical protein ACTS46_01825 [Candidatus Hodgkinia cicadicola]
MFRRVFGGNFRPNNWPMATSNAHKLERKYEGQSIITSRSFRREITSKVRTAYDSSLDCCASRRWDLLI